MQLNLHKGQSTTYYVKLDGLKGCPALRGVRPSFPPIWSALRIERRLRRLVRARQLAVRLHHPRGDQ